MPVDNGFRIRTHTDGTTKLYRIWNCNLTLEPQTWKSWNELTWFEQDCIKSDLYMVVP